MALLPLRIEKNEGTEMKETQKKRAVIVLDIETEKDTDLIIGLHKIVQKAADGIVGAINKSPLHFRVEHHIAGVMAAQRRGETRSIDEIVFRGNRGKNSKLKLPTTTTAGVVISAGCKKRLQALRKRIADDKDALKMLQYEADYIMDAVLKTGRTEYSPYARKLMEQDHAV